MNQGICCMQPDRRSHVFRAPPWSARSFSGNSATHAAVTACSPSCFNGKLLAVVTNKSGHWLARRNRPIVDESSTNLCIYASGSSTLDCSAANSRLPLARPAPFVNLASSSVDWKWMQYQSKNHRQINSIANRWPWSGDRPPIWGSWERRLSGFTWKTRKAKLSVHYTHLQNSLFSPIHQPSIATGYGK